MYSKILILAAIPFLTAMTEVQMVPEVLIEKSQTIVDAVAVKQRIEKVNGVITTTTEFAPAQNPTTDSYAKTQMGYGNFEISQIGGQIGNEGVIIPGAVQFKEKQRYILFLENNRNGKLVLISHSSGAWDVVNGKVLPPAPLNLRSLAPEETTKIIKETLVNPLALKGLQN